jgi:uncharacterized cupin superfamily protein
MIPINLNASVPPLDSWGTPEDIGAETFDGPIAVAGKIVFGALGGAVSGGYYSATRGRYRLVYPFHEHATLIEGELAITDESTGVTNVYGPGDSWIIAQGTPLVWEIRSDFVSKSYLTVTVAV